MWFIEFPSTKFESSSAHISVGASTKAFANATEKKMCASSQSSETDSTTQKYQE